MTTVTLPVTRPAGRALVVGSDSCRAQPVATLHEAGFVCVETDDPYAAMAELAAEPHQYAALVLSLQGLYLEELLIIASVKKWFGAVDVWLSGIEGRHAALAEAMRLGADGLIGADGLHRLGLTNAAPAAPGPSGAVNGSLSAAASLTAGLSLEAAANAAPTAPHRAAADAGSEQRNRPDGSSAPAKPLRHPAGRRHAAAHNPVDSSAAPPAEDRSFPDRSRSTASLAPPAGAKPANGRWGKRAGAIASVVPVASAIEEQRDPALTRDDASDWPLTQDRAPRASSAAKRADDNDDDFAADAVLTAEELRALLHD